LAAGRGTRLRPLTYHVPKPMLRIAGKNLIEHNLDKLPAEIDELIFVVNYLKEQIVNHFGYEFGGRKVKYVYQKDMLGTGHALKACQKVLADRFLVMMGDDIYSKADIEESLKHEQCIVAKETSGKFAGGRIKLNSQGNLEDILEGAHKSKAGGLANLGLYVLTDKFFDYNLEKIYGGKEYGLPQTLVKVAQDHPVKIVRATDWIQISDLAGLKRAEKILTSKQGLVK